jgi:hypothetical protein
MALTDNFVADARTYPKYAFIICGLMSSEATSKARRIAASFLGIYGRPCSTLLADLI